MTPRQKLMVVVTVCITAAALALVGNALVRYADSRSNAVSILIECTTPGPNPPPATGHACFDRSTEATVGAVRELQRSMDCVAFWAAGRRPPACTETLARMDVIQAGGDPFAQPPVPAPPPPD